METKKIAVACFVGGALCCAVALIFAPVYWWLGLIAGFAGGYISYEFREVRRAVPIALHAARKGGTNVWDKVRRAVPIALHAARKGGTNVWDKVIAYEKVWLSKPHPFFYPAAIVTFPFHLRGVYYFSQSLMNDTRMFGLVEGTFLLILLFGVAILFFVEATCVVIAPFAILAFIGARVGERCYWWPFLMPSLRSEKQKEEDAKELEKKGLQRKPATYSNLLHWTAKGFGLTVMFFAWTLWKYLAIGVWETLCFFRRFAWHLFKLIHSDKRLLCAIDGTLGGAVSYIWFISASMSFTEQAVLVVFGGLLGAVFGVANWEIISKRILHVSGITS